MLSNIYKQVMAGKKKYLKHQEFSLRIMKQGFEIIIIIKQGFESDYNAIYMKQLDCSKIV